MRKADTLLLYTRYFMSHLLADAFCCKSYFWALFFRASFYIAFQPCPKRLLDRGCIALMHRNIDPSVGAKSQTSITVLLLLFLFRYFIVLGLPGLIKLFIFSGDIGL